MKDNRLYMAPTGGFEPLACRLGGGRSIRLSYVGKTLKSISFQAAFVNLLLITGIREVRYKINLDFHSLSFLLQCQQIRKDINSLDILKQEPEDSK